MDDEPDRDVDDVDADADVDEERRRAAALAEAERRLLADANEVARDNAMRERGRKIGGAAGAALAGAMIAIRDIYEGPPKDEGSVVVDSPTEPEDVDRDVDAAADADVDVDEERRRAA
ncbi:MAG TPA: hypothetical protein VFT09_08240, partial [Ilumatobacteraceae bacterium]|nr:hypothetical protein [Ilumatobacteraceae bacterium]